MLGYLAQDGEACYWTRATWQQHIGIDPLRLERCADIAGFAPSSVASSKRLREDRSSVATTMPEKISGEGSWPEELDDGVEQHFEWRARLGRGSRFRFFAQRRLSS